MLFKRRKRESFRVLAHRVLNTEDGKALLERMYEQEVLVPKKYDSPTDLAGQAARSDLILSLVQLAKIPESLLTTYAEIERVNAKGGNALQTDDDWD